MMRTTGRRRHTSTLYVVLGVVGVGLLVALGLWRTHTLRVEGVRQIGRTWIEAVGRARSGLAGQLRALGAEFVVEEGSTGARADHSRGRYTATIALVGHDSLDRSVGRLDLVLELGAGDALVDLSDEPVVTYEIRELPHGLPAERVGQVLLDTFDRRVSVEPRL